MKAVKAKELEEKCAGVTQDIGFALEQLLMCVSCCPLRAHNKQHKQTKDAIYEDRLDKSASLWFWSQQTPHLSLNLFHTRCVSRGSDVKQNIKHVWSGILKYILLF